MRAEVENLLYEVVVGRRSSQDRAVRWFATADPADRSDLLDNLALSARSCEPARQTLLTIVAVHQLARPAITRLILDRDTVEDVEHDVLAAVARSVDRFRGEARFTTWLHSVARNAAVDFIRRRRDTTVLDDAEVVPGERRLSSVISTSASVRAAIDALPEHFREPLRLREIDHLSYRQISETLGINMNTTRTRILRGRALLFESLGPAAVERPVAGDGLAAG